MFGNYQSSENETSNYACRQTLNMYDKVCTNRLLSVAVCTWQFFFPSICCCCSETQEEEEVKSDLELWKSWHNTVLAFIYIRQAILLILLSFITFRFRFFFFYTSYYPSRMSTLFIKTLDVWMLTNDPDELWTLADLKFIKMEPQLINFGTISNRFDSKINIYAAELSYLVLRMRIAISYSLANRSF